MAGKTREEERMRQKVDDPKLILTDAERFNLEVLISKQAELQQALNKVAIALSGFINQTVVARGLNPKNWGVNLGAGRILPVDMPRVAPPPKNGGGPEQV